MELPDLGQQCSHTDCKQLDFLPLQCKCGKQFCSEHFNEHVKQCDVFDRSQVEPQKIDKVYRCSESNCKETSLVPLLCQRCGQHFCIKHRHLTECYPKDEKLVAEEKEKLVAPVKQFNEAKSLVDKQIERNLTEAKKKQKNVQLAYKVQLMKIKNKAKGLKTIPTLDRVYFSVIYPGNEQGVPLFVSKMWSVGRVTDAIAEECKLKNDNNKSTGKKLRLFKKENGEIITKNLADSLQILINTNVIVDGESLIIDYVE